MMSYNPPDNLSKAVVQRTSQLAQVVPSRKTPCYRVHAQAMHAQPRHSPASMVPPGGLAHQSSRALRIASETRLSAGFCTQHGYGAECLDEEMCEQPSTAVLGSCPL